MEEDQEKEHIKHVCKFCNKSFPCGRSLGGHMRSHHVTNFSAENEKMKKLSSEEKETTGFSEGGGGYYGLRENPKKTWKRLTNSSEEEEKETSSVVVLDKLCKECGRGFQSWKALFGHMKCHSDKEKVILNDSQSDDDDDIEVNVPNRKRRSKRKRTRYMKKTTTTTTSVTSSVSFAVNSEIEYEYEYEQEQEEVAISLMMLSRDVSNWGGINSIGELETVSKIEGKRVISNGSETEKLVKQSDKKFEFGTFNEKNSEIFVTKNDRFSNSLHFEKTVSNIEGKRVISNGSEIGKLTRVYGKEKKFKIDSESELVVSKSKKSKYFDSEKKSNSYEISKKSYKKGKFECTTCNKIFHSYQALGGHRASHKRNKGCCFASKIENSENNTEFEEESNEVVKNIEYVEEEEEYGELESQSQRVMVEVEEESLPEIRNFLDLNLPAASTDEENNGNHDAEIYKPWWLVGSNHNQETFIGLLTN